MNKRFAIASSDGTPNLTFGSDSRQSPVFNFVIAEPVIDPNELCGKQI